MTKACIILLLVILYLTPLYSAFSQGISTSVYEGKYLFDAACENCHNISQPGTGPSQLAMRNDRRLYGIDWIVKFVNNSAKLISEKDMKAIKINRKYNRLIHPAFPGYDKKQLSAVYDYIENLK